jgi:hypothetical protein
MDDMAGGSAVKRVFVRVFTDAEAPAIVCDLLWLRSFVPAFRTMSPRCSSEERWVVGARKSLESSEGFLRIPEVHGWCDVAAPRWRESS